MATELGQAYVQIIPSAKGIKGSIEKVIGPEAEPAGKSIGGKLSASILSVSKMALKAGAAGLGAVITGSIFEGAKLEQSIGGVETLFKTSAGTVRKYADDAYKTAGISANSYMEQVTSFSASLLSSLGGDTAKAAKAADMAIIDMADNANKMGTPIEEIQRAYQGFAKGNFQMLDNLKLGFAGTKGGMEDLLKKATKLSGVEYNIDNLDDMFNAIHVIQTELGITGTTALEAEETVSGSFNAMKSAFKNTLGSLAIGENVQGSFQALAQTTSTFLFGNFIPMVFEILKNIPTGIETLVRTAIPTFISEGQKLFASLAEGVRNSGPVLFEQVRKLLSESIKWIAKEFPTFVSNGVSLIVNFATGIYKAMPQVISNVGVILQQLLTAIFKAIPSIMQGGFDLITGLAKGLWNNLPAIVSSISRILSNITELIIREFPNIQRKGLELIGKLATGIWNNLPHIISTLSKLLVQLIGSIARHIPAFIAKGFDLVIHLGNGLIKAVPNILARIPQIMSSIFSAFGRLTGQFDTIGADIVKGLWRGINSVKDWILGKISGFVSSITGGIKKFFGIKSPSTVMADEVGKWLPLGLAEGIEDNTSPVTKAMENLAAMTTGTLESEIAMSATMANGQQSVVVARNNNLSENDLYNIIVRALSEGLKLEWHDRELGRMVRTFA